MRSIFRTGALLMAALCLFTVGGCRSSDETPEETSIEETTSSEPSKEESSKVSQQSSKPVSSELEEPSEYVTPHLGPVYVDSSREIIADLASYYASNSDTVAWVNVPNTLANDVVLQYKDDAFEVAYGRDPYYLYKNFYGNYRFAGSLFLDYRSSIEAKNQLIHGHSMADGTMFAGILNYESLSFYQAGPVITYNTLYDKAKWKIIAVSLINTNEDIGSVFRYLRSTFASDYDFLNYVYQMRERSVIDCPVTVNESDTLVTLSTCAYGFGVDGLRLAVVARKVRPGEDTKVKVSDAAYNPDTLHPDIWYNYYGGSRPNVTSFQDALNNKKITWYDGKKKYTAKDDAALAQALADAKKDAYKMVQESYKPEEYYDAQLRQIQEIIDIYKPYVDDAPDYARVNDLLLQQLAAIEHVQKKPEDVLKAEASQREEEKKHQQQVDKLRKEIVTNMQNYVKGKHYREAQQKKVDNLINTYKEKVYTTDDIEILEEMKKNSMRLISEIQTDEQLKAKEKAANKSG